MRCRFFLQRVARDRIQGSLLEHKSRSLSDAPRPPPRAKPSPPTLSAASPPRKGHGTAHGAPNDHAGTFAARLATASPLWNDPSNNDLFVVAKTSLEAEDLTTRPTKTVKSMLADPMILTPRNTVTIAGGYQRKGALLVASSGVPRKCCPDAEKGESSEDDISSVAVRLDRAAGCEAAPCNIGYYRGSFGDEV